MRRSLAIFGMFTAKSKEARILLGRYSLVIRDAFAIRYTLALHNALAIQEGVSLQDTPR